MKIKEMSFRPGTSDHDLGHKVKKVREFLDDGDRVKLIVKFRGREMTHRDKTAPLIFSRLMTYLSDAVPMGEQRTEGRSVSLVIKKR